MTSVSLPPSRHSQDSQLSWINIFFFWFIKCLTLGLKCRGVHQSLSHPHSALFASVGPGYLLLQPLTPWDHIWSQPQPPQHPSGPESCLLHPFCHQTSLALPATSETTVTRMSDSAEARSKSPVVFPFHVCGIF